MQQDLNSLISNGTENGEHHAPFAHCGGVWFLKNQEERKQIFSQLKGMLAGKIVRIFSLNYKIIVILGFCDKTRNH